MEVTHEMRVSLWVAGRLQHLRAEGLLSGPADSLTPKGIALFDQLDASGFRPSVGDVHYALGAFNNTPPECVDPDLVLLVLTNPDGSRA